MYLTEMLTALKTELQDADEDIYTEDELIRAVEKSVSLMSRFIPKRDIIETTIIREVNDEALTISSSEGTLAYKPIKVGSLVITGKTLDTDYRVNYLTGVVTEIGSNLTDGAYVANYDLDPQTLDISSLLPDYIKVERYEYPAGDTPPTLITGDVFGDFVTFRGNVTLTEDKHLRLIYLKKWTPPTLIADGDYPSNLDDAVIIGSVGQALIFKAETYTQAAITAIAASKTALDGVTAVTMPTVPDISAKITDAETALTAAIARFAAGVTAVGSMDTPLGNAATALGKVATELAAGKAYLTDGDDFINTATRGAAVGETYGAYAQALAVIGRSYGEEGAQHVALAAGWEAKAARQNTLGSSYINEAIQRLTIIARLVEKYQIEVAKAGQDVEYYNTQLNKAGRYETTARQYLEIAGRYLSSGQAKINEFLVSLGIKTEFPMQKASSEQHS